jgi:hypothetical protein
MSESTIPGGSTTKESVVLSSWAGLRNNTSSERLAPNDLERATNIDLDDTGQPRRRRGYTLVSAGSFHSIWTSSRGVLGVKNGALGFLTTNYTFVQLQTGIGPTPLAYVEIGPEIYFSSETNSGIIAEDNSVSAWGAVASEGTWLSPVVNPTATLSPISGRLLGKPPMATSLTHYNGRIYLANDRTLWATEMYLYRYTDKTKNFFQFESPITALGSVADGFFVGTETGTWFLSGNLREMRRVAAEQEPVIRGSMHEVSPDSLPEIPLKTRKAVVFMTPGGVCAGLDGGMVVSLTGDRMWFPDATRVASLFRRQDGINQYIAVADSGGTPSSNARIGDHVDAEIRRRI